VIGARSTYQHPAAELARNLASHLDPQARLTDTASSGERHEPVVGEYLPHVVHLGVSAHETRELDRKMLGDNGVRCTQRREVVANVGMA
jgi:hypothetical protein